MPGIGRSGDRSNYLSALKKSEQDKTGHGINRIHVNVQVCNTLFLFDYATLYISICL